MKAGGRVMAVYVASYDLKLGSGTHDYQDLYDAFDALESHKILYSVYLVASDASAEALWAYLNQHMDPKDRLWVSEVHRAENWYRAMAGTTAWLKAHPPRP